MPVWQCRLQKMVVTPLDWNIRYLAYTRNPVPIAKHWMRRLTHTHTHTHTQVNMSIFGHVHVFLLMATSCFLFGNYHFTIYLHRLLYFTF